MASTGTASAVPASLRLRRPPERCAHAPQDSVDWDTTKNLMIEGDNLEVLKLLQKSYSGKVKLIYIDPPYNTGKDFVYPGRLPGQYQELPPTHRPGGRRGQQDFAPTPKPRAAFTPTGST
jgi:hypothetical protein